MVKNSTTEPITITDGCSCLINPCPVTRDASVTIAPNGQIACRLTSGIKLNPLPDSTSVWLIDINAISPKKYYLCY